MTGLVLSRGERNRNPGNIVYDPANHWLGQTGIEEVPAGASYAPRFARFSAPHYGIRALAKLLRTYMVTDQCSTVAAIATRWAPPTENATSSYIDDLSAWTGLAPHTPLAADAPTLAALTRAIIRRENGRVPYDDDLIAAAVRSALPVGGIV